MRTVKRPSRISSVPSKRKTNHLGDINNKPLKNGKNFDDENNANNPNPQWRKLRPPNFASSTNDESEIHSQTLNSQISQPISNNDKAKSTFKPNNSKPPRYNFGSTIDIESKSDINTSHMKSINNINNSKESYQSIKRKQRQINNFDIDDAFNSIHPKRKRASSVTREIRHKNNDSDLKSNFLYTYRPSSRRTDSINFDEFKNPDGSPKKLSQKFHQLQNASKNHDVIREKTNKKDDFIEQRNDNEDMTTPRKPEPCIRRKRHLLPTPTRDTTEIMDNFDQPPKNQSSEISESRPSTIDIALSRIQRELKSKDVNSTKKSPGIKPFIKRKQHRARLEIQEQNATTIDFPNYQAIQNEQPNKNKSVIEEVKPHVTFIGNFQPPKKKDPEFIIVQNDIAKPQKQFVEPTKSDFGKKFEFPPEFMKNLSSSIMNSPKSNP